MWVNIDWKDGGTVYHGIKRWTPKVVIKHLEDSHVYVSIQYGPCVKFESDSLGIHWKNIDTGESGWIDGFGDSWTARKVTDTGILKDIGTGSLEDCIYIVLRNKK